MIVFPAFDTVRLSLFRDASRFTMYKPRCNSHEAGENIRTSCPSLSLSVVTVHLSVVVRGTVCVRYHVIGVHWYYKCPAGSILSTRQRISMEATKIFVVRWFLKIKLTGGGVWAHASRQCNESSLERSEGKSVAAKAVGIGYRKNTIYTGRHAWRKETITYNTL